MIQAQDRKSRGSAVACRGLLTAALINVYGRGVKFCAVKLHHKNLEDDVSGTIMEFTEITASRGVTHLHLNHQKLADRLGM